MDIVEEIRANGEKGAKRLEAEYKDRLMTVALRLCRDRTEAAAFVNQTFAEAVRRIETLNKPESFFSWLCSILVNCHAAATRRREHDGVVYTAAPPETEIDGAAQVIQAVDARLLHDEIDRLPSDLREALMLRYFMDLPLAKCAKILSLPIGTVKSRLYYARVLLGQRLGARLRKPAVALLSAALCLAASVAAVIGLSGHAGGGGQSLPSAAASASAAPRPASAGADTLSGDPPDDPAAEATADGMSPSAAAASSAPVQTLSSTRSKGGVTMNLSTISRGLKALALSAFAVANAGASAHAADAYIQSDGGQVLNTGYCIGSKTKIVVDYAFTDVSLTGGRRLFGVYHRGANAGFYFNSSGALLFESGTGNNAANTATGLRATQGVRQIATLDLAGHTASIASAEGVVLWSGDLVASGAVTANATSPLALFSTTTAALPEANGFTAAAKLYAFRIYEDGKLVRDFTPALFDSPDGAVPGLRDAVTGVFLSVRDLAGGAAPETDVAYGGDIETFTEPYLESDGTQSLNTGVYMDNATRVEIDFAETVTEQNSVLLGAWNFTGWNRLVLPYLNGGYIKIAEGGSDADHGGAWTLNQQAVAENLYRHTAVADGPAQLLSLVTGATTNKTFAMKHDFDTPAAFPIAVFAAGRNATGTSTDMKAKARVYAVRIYKAGALAHDFRPARRNGVPGLRDAVTGAFLADGDTTFSTTGTAFATGGDLPEANDPYLEADGTQGFAIPVAEYAINAKTKVVVDYAFTAANSGKRLFGVYTRGATASIYQNGSGNVVIEGGDETCGNTSTGLKGNLLRHTVTLALGNQEKASFVTGVTTNWSGNLTKCTTTGVATAPLAIFSTSTADSGPTATWGEKARIYRFKVYDGDTLKYDLRPYVKDGVAGFRNTVDGSFLAPFFGSAVRYGGDIEGECPAYVQAVRTSGTVGQAIDTGYYPNPDTKIVVDFQYDDVSNDGRLFGTYKPSASRTGFYRKSQGQFAIESKGGEETTIPYDTKRHVATLDYSRTIAGSSSLATDGNDVWTGAVKDAITSRSTNPLILFGTYTDTIGYFASARIYSFRIYEGASLVHEYLPYKNGDAVGFWDTCEAKPLYECTGSEGTFGYGGMGVDGAEKWLVAPASRRLSQAAGTVTLSANASGAVSYKWTKNGVALDGGADGELDVTWAKGGVRDEYTVTAVYTLYGVAREGAPFAVTVENVPGGTMLMLR